MADSKGRQESRLPSPSANFTLPSLFDDLELDCRIYFPRRKSENGLITAKGCAIFAHPYAPLGGCYDDPVVNSVGSVILRQGYLLVTFNFRGANESPGKTSWSGRAELGDYTAIYAFCLSLLNVPGVWECMSEGHDADSKVGPILLLGGYSYGSMIAAHSPDVDVVHDCLDNAHDGSAEKEIENRAHELGIAFLGFCETQQARGRNSRKASGTDTPTNSAVTMGGYDSPDAARRISRERSLRKVEVERVRHSVERVRRKLGGHFGDPSISNSSTDIDHTAQTKRKAMLPEVRYLLVSPLLGPVATFATMFSRLKFERRGRQDLPHTVPETMLSTHASLIVYGTADHFTASAKVRAWCSTIKAQTGSLLVSEEVQGAGHFWHDPNFESKLTRAVEIWLTSF